MTITRCDNCKKKLKYGQYVYVRPTGGWQSVEICNKCAEPILETLNNYEILQKNRYQSLLNKSKKL